MWHYLRTITDDHETVCACQEYLVLSAHQNLQPLSRTPVCTGCVRAIINNNARILGLQVLMCGKYCVPRKYPNSFVAIRPRTCAPEWAKSGFGIWHLIQTHQLRNYTPSGIIITYPKTWDPSMSNDNTTASVRVGECWWIWWSKDFAVISSEIYGFERCFYALIKTSYTKRDINTKRVRWERWLSWKILQDAQQTQETRSGGLVY